MNPYALQPVQRAEDINDLVFRPNRQTPPAQQPQQDGQPITVQIPHLGTSVQFPAGTDPNSIMQNIQADGILGGQQSPVAGLAQLMTQAFGGGQQGFQPDVPLANYSGKQVFGLTPEQYQQSAQAVRQSQMSIAEQKMQNRVLIERQLESEKDRSQQLKLHQQVLANQEAEAKIREQEMTARAKATTEGKVETAKIKAKEKADATEAKAGEVKGYSPGTMVGQWVRGADGSMTWQEAFQVPKLEGSGGSAKAPQFHQLDDGSVVSFDPNTNSITQLKPPTTTNKLKNDGPRIKVGGWWVQPQINEQGARSVVPITKADEDEPDMKGFLRSMDQLVSAVPIPEDTDTETFKQQISEADVRLRAEAYGVDPDEAVAKLNSTGKVKMDAPSPTGNEEIIRRAKEKYPNVPEDELIRQLKEDGRIK